MCYTLFGDTMKILFLSDIHGIPDNLNYLRKLDEKEKFDKIVVLGDLYSQGPSYNEDKVLDSKKVLEFLNSYKDKVIAVRGNCDSNVDIKASDFMFSDDLALLSVDGINIYCTHGNKYNRYNNDKLNKNSILIYGHEHYPYIIKENDFIFINVGSISLPRNGSEPSYGIYNDKAFTIYDIHNTIVDYISFE